MERFVFFAAIVMAAIFAIGLAFGNGDYGFHFDIDDEDGPHGMAELVQLAPGQLAAQSYGGDRLRVRNAAARIIITPEERTDYAVEISNPGHAPMPTISTDEGRITIDGHLRGRIIRCTDTGVDLRGYESLTTEQMPVITIRAPRSLDLEVGGASHTEIAAAESVELEHSGCGETIIGDVTGDLNVDLAGSGEVRTGAAHSVSADIAGSGRLVTGAIAQNANIDIAGSGSAELAALNGDLQADGAGSGNVAVRGGALARAEIDLAGSGDVEISAPVQALNVSIVGSGDVVVNGAVGDIDADIAGSGGVRAQSVTGAVRQQVWGSGSVRIGQ